MQTPTNNKTGLWSAAPTARLGRLRCAIRSPVLRRVSAIVFWFYLLKGFAWLGLAWWLWT